MGDSVAPKIDGEQRLTENTEFLKVKTGHEPYFTLTPAGARALRNYIAVTGTGFCSVSGESGVEEGVLTPVLGSFLMERLGIGRTLDARAISQFLGPVSRGFNQGKEDMVAVDLAALIALGASTECGK